MTSEAARNQVKSMIGITDTSQDALIDQYLDDGRIFSNYDVAETVPTFSPGGVVSYFEFNTPSRSLMWFDSDTVVTDANYNILIPDTVDFDNGRWEFLITQNLVMLIRGFSYDPYGAAADTLRTIANDNAENLTSFSTQGGNFAFSNISESYAKNMARFESKRRRFAIGVKRADVRAGNSPHGV